jgi:hypothetical protein
MFRVAINDLLFLAVYWFVGVSEHDPLSITMCYKSLAAIF